MTDEYDIAVIGDGPAGAAAAIIGARAGLRILLVGRLRASDGEAIDESVHPGCLVLLRRLGVTQLPSLGAFPGITVGGVFQPFGADEAGPWLGAHLDRRALDMSLRAQAEAVGAVARSGIFEVERADGGFRLMLGAEPVASARRLIDATGRSSWLRRRFNLRARRLSVPLLAWRGRGRSDQPEGAPATFDYTPQGWRWRASLRGGVATWTEVRRAEARRATPAPAGRPTSVTWRLTRPAAGPGWCLAGDAAGALDPASGAGIHFALESGARAVLTSIACLRRTATGSVCEALYDDWIVTETERRARVLKSLYLNI